MAGIISLSLASCDTWLGEDEDPPLEGERISIVAGTDMIRPDPTIIDENITLPRPYINPDWPQAGGYASHALYHLQLSGEVTAALESEYWCRNLE